MCQKTNKMKKLKTVLNLGVLALSITLLTAGCATASKNASYSPLPPVEQPAVSSASTAGILTANTSVTGLPPMPPNVPASASSSTNNVLAEKRMKLTTRLPSGYLIVSNPPPAVEFTWDAPTPVPGIVVTNYVIYMGTNSGQYYMSGMTGNTNLMLSFTNSPDGTNFFQRGVTYYSVATAQAGGLESGYSNEVNWNWSLPPNAPNMHNAIHMAVLSTPSLTAPVQWVATGMDNIVPADAQSQFYKLFVGPVIPTAP